MADEFNGFVEESKERARDLLKRANDALEPYHDQLQTAEKETRKAADVAEKVARDSHIDQIAETVQTVDMVHGVARGGLKMAQALRNEETREAMLKAARETSELIKDPAALKARMEEGLREFKEFQGHGPKLGMRPQDEDAFATAATDHQRWVGVRHTNPESFQYIGEEGYTPKPIECKAKTADVPGHPHAGLIVDPYEHPSAYKKPLEAQHKWDEMRTNWPEGVTVDQTKGSPRYGCLQYRGKYVHADYDLYDIVDPQHSSANLSQVTELRGQEHFQARNLPDVANHVNHRIGSPMIQHGGQYQFSDHTNDTVTFFGPKGERVHVTGQKALREFYGENFPGRLPPPADPHGVPSCPVERGFERTGPTHIVVEGQDAPPARPIGRGHGKLEPPPPRQAPNPEVSNVVPFRRK